MRRILALVCIFILLLFTGIPMFTSNLLCNQTNVYADTLPEEWRSDRAKAIAGLSVFLNDHRAFLYAATGNSSVDVDKFSMYLIDGFVLPFLEYYRFEQQTISALADLAEYITVENDPFIVRMYSPAVSFYNAFLQWLIDTGRITNDQTNNNLYDGYSYGNELFYKIKTTDNIGSNNVYGTYTGNLIELGSPVSGLSVSNLISYYNSKNTVTGAGSNFNSSYASSNGTNEIRGNYVNIDIQYYSDVTHRSTLYYSNVLNYNNNYSIQGKCPYLFNDTVANKTNLDRFIGGLVYCADGSYGIPCRFCFQNNASSVTYYGWVGFNVSNSKYTFYKFGRIGRSNNDGISNANINFNKDDFDSTPTTPPTGSDGYTYQPKQDGTGNTYNTYNDYYSDYHEGDTYIYHPSDSGGGGNDPGGGGDDPTPGGTTPPWDGSGSDGLYSQGGTLTPDGNGGYNLNFPDVGLPDLNIDWSINGLKEKFPFSIPWDLMAFFAVMNAEPETPEIQATIPLGLWEWDIDWDLHAFDNVARILRNMELIGFCIGLILITRSIIKG